MNYTSGLNQPISTKILNIVINLNVPPCDYRIAEYISKSDGSIQTWMRHPRNYKNPPAILTNRLSFWYWANIARGRMEMSLKSIVSTTIWQLNTIAKFIYNTFQLLCHQIHSSWHIICPIIIDGFLIQNNWNVNTYNL